MYKFSDVFEFHKKSKIKAGDGKPKGKCPLYTSSTELNRSGFIPRSSAAVNKI